MTNILTHCKWYDVQFLCPKKKYWLLFWNLILRGNTYIFQVLIFVLFSWKILHLSYKILFSDKKKEGLSLQTLKKTQTYTCKRKKFQLSAYARLNSIYNYIIRSKYLVKSYANIFLFLLAQMTKPSDNIYTTVRSLKSI